MSKIHCINFKKELFKYPNPQSYYKLPQLGYIYAGIGADLCVS